jgi:hypothetical protein
VETGFGNDNFHLLKHFLIPQWPIHLTFQNRSKINGLFGVVIETYPQGRMLYERDTDHTKSSMLHCLRSSVWWTSAHASTSLRSFRGRFPPMRGMMWSAWFCKHPYHDTKGSGYFRHHSLNTIFSDSILLTNQNIQQELRKESGPWVSN